MRVWSIHPKYLDKKGLGGLWCESLLAKAVLLGKTKGYTHHPQLIRFRDSSDPVKYISTYLRTVHEEAVKRGLNYDGSKVGEVADLKPLTVTKGQLEYEWKHLVAKLKKRAPEWLAQIPQDSLPETNPIFVVVEGDIASWEIVDAPQSKPKAKKSKKRGKSSVNNSDAQDETAEESVDTKRAKISSADESVSGKKAARSSKKLNAVKDEKIESDEVDEGKIKNARSSKNKVKQTDSKILISESNATKSEVTDVKSSSKRSRKPVQQVVEQPEQPSGRKRLRSSTRGN